MTKGSHNHVTKLLNREAGQEILLIPARVPCGIRGQFPHRWNYPFFAKPNVNAPVIRKSRGVRMSVTNSGLKNSNCDPMERNASEIPPRPINAPPIPTHRKPLVRLWRGTGRERSRAPLRRGRVVPRFSSTVPYRQCWIRQLPQILWRRTT